MNATYRDFILDYGLAISLGRSGHGNYSYRTMTMGLLFEYVVCYVVCGHGKYSVAIYLTWCD